MQAMPTAYVAYGWRKYESGRCSYKGHTAPCPDYHQEPDYHQDYRHEHHEDRHNGHHHQDYHRSSDHEFFFDSLHLYPRPDSFVCDKAADCCSRNCADKFCCAAGKKAIGQSCSVPANCCSNKCTNGLCAGDEPPEPVCKQLTEQCTSAEECCKPTGQETCDTCGAFACTDDGVAPPTTCCLPNNAVCAAGRPPMLEDDAKCCAGFCNTKDGVDTKCNPCFTGDTQVRVQGISTPVAMRDVQTGQFLQCLDSADDLRVPTTLTWCEVVNWIHAEETTGSQIRLTYAKPSGGQGSQTISPTHMVYKLTAAAAGDEAAAMNLLGAFSLIAAKSVQPGDLIAVLKDEANPAAGFKVVSVLSVATVEAPGYYAPGISKGYLIADGVVSPRSIDFDIPMVGIEGLDGVKQAVPVYTQSPSWMNRTQPLGTPGTSGGWPTGPIWPGIAAIGGANLPHLQAGESLNYPALRDWYLPRYAQWKANPAAAITLDEVLSVLSSDTVWVKPAAGGNAQRREWLSGARY